MYIAIKCELTDPEQSKKREYGRFIRQKANRIDYVHYKFI